MPLKHRKLTNSRRGTEVEFASLSLVEAKEMNDEEIYSRLKGIYGDNISRVGYAEKIHHFIESEGEREMILPVPEIEDKREISDHLYDENYIKLKKVGKRLVVTPVPLLHDIIGYGGGRLYEREAKGISPFEDVKSILEKGFIGKTHTDENFDENAIVKRNSTHVANINSTGKGFGVAKSGITSGDRYTIEFFPKGKRTRVSGTDNNQDIGYQAISSNPEDITRVNIRINPESSQEEIEKKMDFYKKEITQKYSIPVKFFEVSGKEIRDKYGNVSVDYSPKKRLFSKGKGLEHRISGIVGISGLLSSMILVSKNFTGNVIGTNMSSTSNLIGMLLFLIGIAGAFIYFVWWYLLSLKSRRESLFPSTFSTGKLANAAST